jgi:hypothetical protein
MSVTPKQLGMAIEGSIVNFALMAARAHPELSRKERVVELGLQAEQLLLPIIHEIQRGWSREALEGVELNAIRMARVIVGRLSV